MASAPQPMKATPTDAVTMSNGSTLPFESAMAPPITSAPRVVHAKIGPANGRAVVASPAMCTAASTANSTAARRSLCTPKTMAISVGTAARATDAASSASATTSGRVSSRAHAKATTTPVASAIRGQNSTGSTESSMPAATAPPRTRAAPETAVHPVAVPSRRMRTPRAVSGRNIEASATTAPAAHSTSVRSSESPLDATLGSTAIAAATPKSAVRPAAVAPTGARRHVMSPAVTASATASGRV